MRGDGAAGGSTIRRCAARLRPPRSLGSPLSPWPLPARVGCSGLRRVGWPEQRPCRSFPDASAMRLFLTLAAVGSLPACSRNHTDVKAGPETGAVSTTATTQTPRPPSAWLIPARLRPIPAPGDSSPTRQREASIRPASPRACRTAPPGCGIIRLDGREMTAVLLPRHQHQRQRASQTPVPIRAISAQGQALLPLAPARWSQSRVASRSPVTQQ